MCTPALQRPPSGRAGLSGLAPDTPDSTAGPASGLVALKPCHDQKHVTPSLTNNYDYKVIHDPYKAKYILKILRLSVQYDKKAWETLH